MLFGVPVAAVLVVNIVLFALSVRQIRNAAKASQMAARNTDQTQLLVRSNRIFLFDDGNVRALILDLYVRYIELRETGRQTDRQTDVRASPPRPVMRRIRMTAQ